MEAGLFQLELIFVINRSRISSKSRGGVPICTVLVPIAVPSKSIVTDLFASSMVISVDNKEAADNISISIFVTSKSHQLIQH